MRDDNARHLQAVEAVGHDGLGSVIEGAGRLVADDDGRVHGEGFGNQDAAKIMGKSRKQVENLLYYAKKSLRSELEKEGFHYEEL